MSDTYVSDIGEPGYSGNIGYSPRETVRNSVSALVGLAGIVAASTPGFAQELQPVAYRDTNLSQYNVPNVEGLKPYQTRRFDLTDRIPGNETRLDVYKTDKAMIGKFSINGNVFQIGYDTDFKAPTDSAYRDMTGSGNFESYDPQANVVIPEWVLR